MKIKRVFKSISSIIAGVIAFVGFETLARHVYPDMDLSWIIFGSSITAFFFIFATYKIINFKDDK